MAESEYFSLGPLRDRKSIGANSENVVFDENKPPSEYLTVTDSRKSQKLEEAPDSVHRAPGTEFHAKDDIQNFSCNVSTQQGQPNKKDSMQDGNMSEEALEYQYASALDGGNFGALLLGDTSDSRKHLLLKREIIEVRPSMEASDSNHYVSAPNDCQSSRADSVKEFETFQHSAYSSISSRKKERLDYDNENKFRDCVKNEQDVKMEKHAAIQPELVGDDSRSVLYEDNVSWIERSQQTLARESYKAEVRHSPSAKLSSRQCPNIQTSKCFQSGNASQGMANEDVSPNQTPERSLLVALNDCEDSVVCRNSEMRIAKSAVLKDSEEPTASKPLSTIILNNDTPSAKVFLEADTLHPANAGVAETEDIQSCTVGEKADESQISCTEKKQPLQTGVSQPGSKEINDFLCTDSHSTKYEGHSASEKNLRDLIDQPLPKIEVTEDDSLHTVRNSMKSWLQNSHQEEEHFSHKGQKQHDAKDNSPLTLSCTEDEALECSQIGQTKLPVNSSQPTEDSSPTSHSGNSSCRVKAKPSVVILRLQEQLRQGLEYGDAKARSKVEQLHEMLLNHETGEEIIEPLLHNPQSGSELSRSDRKHIQDAKQTKPYRQWHRISKCVAADSRYIISSLPQPPPVPLLKHRNDSAARVKTDESVSANLPEICIHPAESASDNEIQTSSLKAVDNVMKCVPTDEDSSLDSILENAGHHSQLIDVKSPDNILENQNKSSAGYTCSPEYHELHVSNEKLDCSPKDSGKNETPSPVTCTNKEDTCFTTTEDTCRPSGALECSHLEQADISISPSVLIDEVIPTEMLLPPFEEKPPQKEPIASRENHTLTQDPRWITPFQCLRNSPPIKQRGITPKANIEIIKINPEITTVTNHFDSISGVSQVTGPPSPDMADLRTQTKPCRYYLPTRGPVLRTATRSRPRKQSPRETVGSNNSFSGSDSLSSNSQARTYHERSISRGAPRNGLRHSSRHTLDVKHGSRPSRAASQHAAEVRALSKGTQCICIQPEDPRDQDLGSSGKHVFSRFRKTCGIAGHDLQVEKKLLLPEPPKSAKVLRPDVACKLLQKVNRVHKTPKSKKYVDVQATVDYSGKLPGQLSFRKGQIIKQRSFLETPPDGISYGYYRVGKLRKKRKGLFPISCVTTPIENNGEDQPGSTTTPRTRETEL